MTTTPRPVAWNAGRDGIAHASRPRDPRALCGLPAVAEAFAWPERSGCPVCVRMVAAGCRPTAGKLPAGREWDAR